MDSSRREVLELLAAAGWLGLCGCRSPRELAREWGAKQRLSVATGGTGGVYYPYGGGIAKVISEAVRNVEATAEVTGGSVDNLKLIRDGRADLALTLADTLDDAYQGRGSFARFGKVPARALAVLFTNYTHVVTLESAGIERVRDLEGHVVSTGSPGGGTETIAFRILEAAGLDPSSDVRRQGLGVGPSVDALKDGKIDAFFWSGGLPTAAVLDLANSPGREMKLLPNDDILPTLQSRHRASLYYQVTVPRGTYTGLTRDVPVVGVSNLLVVDERMSDALAYEITRALFERKADLVAIHQEAENLRLETATSGSPVPFHPGAIRFFREKKAWPN